MLLNNLHVIQGDSRMRRDRNREKERETEGKRDRERKSKFAIIFYLCCWKEELA